MKPALFLWCVLWLSVPVLGQRPSAVAQLAGELVANCTTERQKSDAIFRWITSNISYKVSSSIAASRYQRRRQTVVDEDTSTFLPPLDERVAELVLQRREAVCDGYARLFKVLCDHAGLKAVVVNGYARTGGGSQGNKFRANHSWNAVRIDSSWFLLDATWASGFTNMRGDQFFQYYDSQYYLADPKAFIQDHYPEDPGWTLLPEQPLIREFHHAPFKHTAFVRQQVKGFSPASGIIEAALGDTVMIAVETMELDKKLEIWDQPFGGFLQQFHPDSIQYNYKPLTIEGNKIFYPYVVQSPMVQWLYVVLNGESVLQYRLKIKEPALTYKNGQ